MERLVPYRRYGQLKGGKVDGRKLTTEQSKKANALLNEVRAKLKKLKMKEQAGKCSICGEPLPEKEAELDRFVAWKGYTPKNTQLIHHDCHRRQQQDRGFDSGGETISSR